MPQVSLAAWAINFPFIRNVVTYTPSRYVGSQSQVVEISTSIVLGARDCFDRIGSACALDCRRRSSQDVPPLFLVAK